MLQKVSVLNKCCSYEHYIHQGILKKRITFQQKYVKKNLIKAWIKTRNVSSAANHNF